MLRAMANRPIASLNEARLMPQFRQEVEIEIRRDAKFRTICSNID